MSEGVDFRKRTLLRQVWAVYIMVKSILIMELMLIKQNRLSHKSLPKKPERLNMEI